MNLVSEVQNGLLQRWMASHIRKKRYNKLNQKNFYNKVQFCEWEYFQLKIEKKSVKKTLFMQNIEINIWNSNIFTSGLTKYFDQGIRVTWANIYNMFSSTQIVCNGRKIYKHKDARDVSGSKKSWPPQKTQRNCQLRVFVLSA